MGPLIHQAHLDGADGYFATSKARVQKLNGSGIRPRRTKANGEVTFGRQILDAAGGPHIPGFAVERSATQFAMVLVIDQRARRTRGM